MTLKQKITRIIILLSVTIAITIPCLFHSTLYPFFLKLFANRFNIVSNKGNMLVHFIDVGQGDASAINLPDGKVVLIDTGTKEVNVNYVNYIKENVLNTKTNKFIDYLILSHADMDHIGGTIKLLKTFEVGEVYMPKFESTSQGYLELSSYVEENCKYTTLGEEFMIETNSYKIQFFEILNETNTNDSSQLIKIESFNKSFLFTGDISSNIEQDYIDKYGEELDVDVLKVSHHGSNSSSSQEFLEIVSPNYAVISVGFGNDYGHPTYDVLTRLNNVGAKILRTDKSNNILFVIDDNVGLININDTYYVTGLSLDYIELILVLDVCLIVSSVLIVLKKDKRKRRKRKN